MLYEAAASGYRHSGLMPEHKNNCRCEPVGLNTLPRSDDAALKDRDRHRYCCRNLLSRDVHSGQVWLLKPNAGRDVLFTDGVVNAMVGAGGRFFLVTSRHGSDGTDDTFFQRLIIPRDHISRLEPVLPICAEDG